MSNAQPPPSPLAVPHPWDLVASAYEVDIVPVFECYSRAALHRAGFPTVGPHPSNARIVDVACGPGTLSLIAARAGYHVDALDFSPAMIERLASRIAEEGTRTVTARVGDGQQLPFEDAAYAGAFSMFGLMFFPDRARGFAELRRVLVRGGCAVVSSWHPLDTNPVLTSVVAAMRDMAPSASGPVNNEAPLSTADICRSEMGASFSRVEVHTVEHPLSYPNVAELWTSLQRTLAPVALMREKAGERWPGVSEQFVRRLEKDLGAGGGSMPMKAWLSVGVAA
jgi:SAM-dependent methyltransferase